MPCTARAATSSPAFGAVRPPATSRRTPRARPGTRPGGRRVGGPPAEQQESAVGEGVAGGHPGQHTRRGPAALHARQRDLGDGQVEGVQQDRRGQPAGPATDARWSHGRRSPNRSSAPRRPGETHRCCRPHNRGVWPTPRGAQQVASHGSAHPFDLTGGRQFNIPPAVRPAAACAGSSAAGAISSSTSRRHARCAAKPAHGPAAHRPSARTLDQSEQRPVLGGGQPVPDGVRRRRQPRPRRCPGPSSAAISSALARAQPRPTSLSLLRTGTSAAGWTRWRWPASQRQRDQAVLEHVGIRPFEQLGLRDDGPGSAADTPYRVTGTVVPVG